MKEEEQGQESPKRTVGRREALGALALTAGLGGAAVIWGITFYEPRRFARPKKSKLRIVPDFSVKMPTTSPQMVVARGPNPAANVRAAVERMGGMGRFVKKGERVLLKPNAAWDRTPEQAANTNPHVVAEVIRLCREAGAGEVIISEVSVNDIHRCLERSGIKAAIKQAGGVLRLPGPNDFVQARVLARLPNNIPRSSTFLTEWPALKFLFEVDRVINLPIAKHHGSAQLTMGMKNWYGAVGGARHQLHQQMDKGIADLATMIRPSLTILDATRVLLTNGPTGGRLEDVVARNAVVAGVDPVAVDAYGCSFFNMKPSELGYIQLAEERKLGTPHYQKLSVVELKVS